MVGIAPAGFEDPIGGRFDFWLPHDVAGDTDDQNNSLSVVARLRRGVSLEQAAGELASLSAVMRERFPKARLGAMEATSLHEDLVAPARTPLTLLFAAVALVLLVACVNVANLTLARATGRVHEFATRTALGAGLSRLVRQLLVESLLLVGLGGLAGLALARAVIEVLKVLGGDAVPRLDEVGFDPMVLGFALAITLATAVVFGVVPALRFARVPPVDAMRQQSRSMTVSRRQGRLRLLLATTQLALALTLLVGAGVLVASFYRLQRVDLGFRADGVLTFEVNLPAVRYAEDESRALFQEELAATAADDSGRDRRWCHLLSPGDRRLPRLGDTHPERSACRDVGDHRVGPPHSAADGQRRYLRGARRAGACRPELRRSRRRHGSAGAASSASDWGQRRVSRHAARRRHRPADCRRRPDDGDCRCRRRRDQRRLRHGGR